MYVIVNTKTKMAYRKHCMTMFYPTEKGAKNATTRLNKVENVWVAMTEAEYRNKYVTTKKVKNLMSGKEIEIASDTPLHMDPSSETYWSM